MYTGLGACDTQGLVSVVDTAILAQIGQEDPLAILGQPHVSAGRQISGRHVVDHVHLNVVTPPTVLITDCSNALYPLQVLDQLRAVHSVADQGRKVSTEDNNVIDGSRTAVQLVALYGIEARGREGPVEATLRQTPAGTIGVDTGPQVIDVRAHHQM
ncbi:MAG: hypothetical protein ACYSYL_00090 [Planctomycetota bacterium]